MIPSVSYWKELWKIASFSLAYVTACQYDVLSVHLYYHLSVIFLLSSIHLLIIIFEILQFHLLIP